MHASFLFLIKEHDNSARFFFFVLGREWFCDFVLCNPSWFWSRGRRASVDCGGEGAENATAMLPKATTPQPLTDRSC